jgi:hypothetical protein
MHKAATIEWSQTALVSAGAPIKQAIAIEPGRQRLAASGILAGSAGASTNIPDVDRVRFGSAAGSTYSACRILNAYLIPNRAPSDAELAAMTA